MSAVFHHQNLLLDDAEVVAGLQLDDLDGRELFMAVALPVGREDSASLVDVAVGSGPDPVQKLVVFLRVPPADVRAEEARVGVARRHAPRAGRVAGGGRRFEAGSIWLSSEQVLNRLDGLERNNRRSRFNIAAPRR